MSAARAAHDFDILVIGAGHAGCEAALAAARIGCRTALVTLDAAAIARMSCNPAIGGLAKGHLVREIDALGGEMARAIDATGIQFRLLNRSRGPAVQAPRAQADKDAYARRMTETARATPGLFVLEGEAHGLVVDGGRLAGVTLADGTLLTARAAVVTTGTFLRGMLHRGLDRRPGGRIGERPAAGLSDALRRLGLPLGRLKTGTPPRVLRSSVDLSRLERQPGDPDPVPFSFVTETITQEQVDCHITWTTTRTHLLVRDNLHRSPLFTGAITAIGPRYCPSIEDKIVRFADRDRHQVFVEPEGREHPWLYLNGVSTSLPQDVQEAMVHSLPGFEEAVVARHGYAVEYDYVEPTACRHTLETRAVRGLYLAGQINGTTGYEEAAALGLMAGINAALAVQGREPLVLARHEAYIGVLVDDLVLKGTGEPYRMFTSRAEHRLLLDIDSADLRLTEHGRRVGLIDADRHRRFRGRRDRIASFVELLEGRTLAPRPAEAALGVRLTAPTTPAVLLRRRDVSLEAMERFLGDSVPEGLREDERRVIRTRMRYGGYLERQWRDVERLRREETRSIPEEFDYGSVPGLSREVVEKLGRSRPGSLAAAGRIPGITPAALNLINVVLEKDRRGRMARPAATSGTPSRPR